jgi:hypothetical protein
LTVILPPFAATHGSSTGHAKPWELFASVYSV